MKKKLKDVCIFYPGTGFPIKYQGDSYGDLPFYKVGDIANNAMIGNSFLDTCKNYISYDIAKKIKGTVVPKNVIVFAKIGEALKLNRRCITSSNCLIDNNVMGIGCNEKYLDLKYFYFFMKNLKMEKLAESTTIPSVRKTKLEEVFIEVPAMKLQLDISKILGILQDIILHRQNQLVHMDNLVKARFVELFGDPTLNNKGFPVYKMGEVVDFQGGSQPDKKYFEYEPTENNIRLIQIRDYKTDRFITYIPKKMAKRFCNVDDIMIGRYGPPIFQILQGIEGSFNVALMKAIPKMGNIEFVRWFLKQDCLLRYLEGMSKRTAGQDGIQMDKLKEYPFIMPPIEMQNEFEQLVKQVNKSKVEVQRALDEAQLIFDSLMQKYFG